MWRKFRIIKKLIIDSRIFVWRGCKHIFFKMVSRFSDESCVIFFRQNCVIFLLLTTVFTATTVDKFPSSNFTRQISLDKFHSTNFTRQISLDKFHSTNFPQQISLDKISLEKFYSENFTRQISLGKCSLGKFSLIKFSL